MSSEKGVATVAERPVDFLCDLERSPVVSSDPHRRGPKKHRFTKTQEMLLYLIAGETVLNGGVRCTKRQLADLVGRNVKTIDRCIASLRREGLIETEMNFDESGGQVSSLYRAVIGQMPGLQDNTGALAAPGHSDLWGEAPRQNEEGEDEPSPKEK